MLSDMEQHPILFPDLDETNAWLKRGPQIRLALFEHLRPTGKHPSLVASLSAHAGFGTTAHSYIHLFPWLTAAALDGAEEMAPAESLVKLACHANNTYRAWLNKHGIHGVAVQLMKSNRADIRVESGSKTNREVLAAPMSSHASWAEQIWGDLHSLCTNDLHVRSYATIAPMARRAEHICNLTTTLWAPSKHL